MEALFCKFAIFAKVSKVQHTFGCCAKWTKPERQNSRFNPMLNLDQLPENEEKFYS